MRQQEDPTLLDDFVHPSHGKSSVASSTFLAAHDEPMDGELQTRCPVDDITEKTPCDLDQSMKNISFKVAVGYALPNHPGATFHGGEIPAGFARVGVDKVLPGFQILDLDKAGGEGETKLGEVEGGIVLWKKEYIVVVEDSTPPRTPPCSNQPQQSPLRPDRTPSSSPPGSQVYQPSQPTPPRIIQRREIPPLPEMEPIKLTSRKPIGGPPKKRQRMPAKEKTPEKLPYDRTSEELDAWVAADTKRQLAPKPKPPSFTAGIPQEKIERCIANIYAPKPPPPTDYERYISKSYSSHEEQRKCGKHVAQLGEQEVQSVPPLKVNTEKDNSTTCFSVAPQVIMGDTGYPIAEVVPRHTYVPGEPLVTREVFENLPTQMRLLHKWYMQASREGRMYLMARVRPQHFFQHYGVHIDFPELFQLYNLLDLDKSLLSCYCL